MEPAHAIQHLPEHLPRHGHLGELEHQSPGMPHQAASGLDELDLRPSQAGRRDPDIGRLPAPKKGATVSARCQLLGTRSGRGLVFYQRASR